MSTIHDEGVQARFTDWVNQLNAHLAHLPFGTKPLVIDAKIPYMLGWSPSKAFNAIGHGSHRDWKELLIRSVAQAKGMEGWESPAKLASVLRPEDIRFLNGGKEPADLPHKSARINGDERGEGQTG